MLSCRPTGHGHRPTAIATCTATGPLSISRSLSHARARQRDIRGFGGACSSLELYEGLPERVRRLVDEAGFGEFILTLSPVRNDHAVLVALAERWRDTTNTFHLPPGEMTVMPTDFATITGLRVGGEPIPFDSGIQEDRAALEWFLGEVPKIEEGMARYDQFKRYLKKKVTNDQEAEQMAIAYLLYLFGASLYPSRQSKVHLSYLSALRDMRTASRFDWGGAALGATYGFLGDLSRIEQSTAGYWRIWELWAYEVLRMYSPKCKHPDLSTLPRVLIWSKANMGTKEGRGDLNAFRLYLDELRASQINWDPWRVAGLEPEYLPRSRTVTASRVLLESAFGRQWYLGDRVTRQSLGYFEFQVPGPLPPRASHIGEYTRAELERFTQPDVDQTRHLRPEMDYATYQRDHLAGPLRIRAFREVRSQAYGAAEERMAAEERQRGGEGRARRSLSGPVVDGPHELPWKIPMVDNQGNPAEIHLVPARVEPTPVTVPVPIEWVNEAVCRLLALENVIRRAASGLPLELHYPAPTPLSAQPAAAQRTQAQGRAAPRRKSARDLPKKKVATRTPAPPVTTRRQTRSSQSAAASQEAAREAVACAEMRYRIKMHKKPSQDEPVHKKRLILPASSKEEEEREEEEREEEEDGEEEGEEDEERSSTSSGSDDSVDDPGYRKDPRERDDDGDWLAED